MDNVAITVDNLWKNSRASPFQAREEPSDFANDPVVNWGDVPYSMSGPPESPSTQYEDHGSDHHDDYPESSISDQDAQNSKIELLENLSKRGKGQYYCPYGTECKKGGLHRDKTPVVFERNSTFKFVEPLYNCAVGVKANIHPNRAHLQKHLKVYKCDVPGCKNRSGFARSDQLERHKKTVAH